MGKEISGALPSMAAIPTTAGTGSEVTKFTIITDTKTDVKMLLKGEVLLPQLAIVDASLSESTPQSVTAATGLDALTHAVTGKTGRHGKRWRQQRWRQASASTIPVSPLFTA